ncbi:short chain dehydrogenase [Colletotrichum costaricense]|uniref:Short chain dehydrogenase n=1 Tax=Colletotrichum costaricense TaxID=1209916 RepID=A0AAJ0DYX6_9PEZI|nr:short chain dehydrogenase [Colletotrichum costaricense]KAK1524112.1 short chain dehydrogenase [Colletotrichum costaricense]
MESTYHTLVQRIILKWAEKRRTSSDTSNVHPRLIIALAGPPGSGKTTIAQKVVSAINASQEPHPKCIVLSADGFHLPLAALRALPNAAEAIARRGAPWTFDGQAVIDLVRQLRASAGLRPVLAPTFDHKVKDPVSDGFTVDADVQVCIVEGNYLLVDDEPWNQIADLVDERWLSSNMATNGSTNGARKSIRASNPPIEDSVFKQFRLDGRTVIITGGAGGIGSEIARGLAEAGANIAIWYNSSKAAVNIAATIAEDFGVKTKAYQVNVTNYPAVEAAVAEAVKDFGRLDVMIANAGIPSKAGGLDDKVEDWDRVRAVDFDGAYYCMRAAGLVFREQKRGVGIITASMSGHAANVPQEQSCYNACKAGTIHLARSLAVEWAKWGGRINSVSPGYIDTVISGDCPFEMKEEWFSLTPLRRDADPRELKGVYLYLASDASSYTTGADFIVDGGYTAR